MKILLITPSIPYPLSEGGKIAQYAMIDALRKHCSIVMALAIHSIHDEKNADILKQHWTDIEIRKIRLIKQEEKISFKRGLIFFLKNHLVRAYQKKNIQPAKASYTFSFGTESPSLMGLFQLKTRKLIDELNSIISEVKPDIVQIDMLEYIDIHLAIPANIKKIFVHHELSFARLLSSLTESKFKITPFDHYVIETVKKKELLFLNLYDAVFVFSSTDKDKLIQEGVYKKIYITPFPVLDECFIRITSENVAIDKLVFVGAENHSPNKDAVEWYIDEIAEEINRTQKIVLHIVGDWSQETKDRYMGNPNIYFAGFVENLVDYCRQSIMIVPIRIGSGIRAKILYAMAQGIPVISTSLGCEGIKARNKENILIADKPEAFAVAFKYILENKNETLRLIQSAQQLVRQNYSQKTAAALRMKYFEQLLSDTLYA